MDQLNYVILENGAESYVIEICRRTFRYTYVHFSRFDSQGKVGEIGLESGNSVVLLCA